MSNFQSLIIRVKPNFGTQCHAIQMEDQDILNEEMFKDLPSPSSLFSQFNHKIPSHVSIHANKHPFQQLMV